MNNSVCSEMLFLATMQGFILNSCIGSNADSAVLRERRDNERGERAHHLRPGRPTDDRTYQDPQHVGRPWFRVSFNVNDIFFDANRFHL